MKNSKTKRGISLLLDISSKSWKWCSFSYSCLIGRSLVNNFFIHKLKLNCNNLNILWFMYCSSMCILLQIYTCPIYRSLVIWTRTVYPNSPGVLWPSPQTAYSLLFPDGVVLKNQKSTWVTTLPPPLLHGAGMFSLLLLSKDYWEVEKKKKKSKKESGDPKCFSSLARVSSEPVERGLPSLNKIL